MLFRSHARVYSSQRRRFEECVPTRPSRHSHHDLLVYAIVQAPLMPVFTALVLCLALVLPAGAADLDPFPDLDVNDPAALQEAARVIEEELKLAARPQTYLIIDLVGGAVQIKGRGVELHRLAILSSSLAHKEQLTGVFRLTARPSVVRRKIDPT